MLEPEALQAAFLAAAGEVQAMVNHLGLAARSAPTAKLVFDSDLRGALRRALQFGRTELPVEAKSAIDQMVDGLKQQKSAVWIEIEGHTDNVGDAAYNERLGMNRAEAVKRYLYEQHQVPLHKMNVISYGETKPVAPNRTRDGRAQNRRVVIKVLA